MTHHPRIPLALIGASLLFLAGCAGVPMALGDVHYPSLFNALINWVEKGQKPTHSGIATSCVQQPGAAAKDCKLLPNYVSKSLASRIFVRWTPLLRL